MCPLDQEFENLKNPITKMNFTMQEDSNLVKENQNIYSLGFFFFLRPKLEILKYLVLQTAETINFLEQCKVQMVTFLLKYAYFNLHNYSQNR